MRTDTSNKTPPQLLKKIWALAKEVGMDEDSVRAITQRMTGQDRLSALSKAEACLIIDAINVYAGKAKSRPRSRISKGQHWKIKQLEKELGWADDPAHLRNFIRKYYKVDHIDWLTPKRASDLIESSKNVLARQQNKHG